MNKPISRPTTRKCPVTDCKTQIEPKWAMCGHHWAKVSDATKNKVVELFRTAKGTRAHLEAIHDAIREAEKFETVEAPKLEL